MIFMKTRNVEWIRGNWKSFVGEWVVLVDGQLVDHDKSRLALHRRLETIGKLVKGTLFIKVEDHASITCAPIDRVRTLRRGHLVMAVNTLDQSGANVEPGTFGVVFETAEFHEPFTGPMVRWTTGGCCNVYDGQTCDAGTGEIF